MKTVSFVVPVYNPPLDLFRGLLDSLLDQSGVGLEIVAVNDGSTNGALGVLREFEAAHPGVFKIIDRENRGAGPSRNEGFLAATGDYVWFVDADDLVRPGAAAFLAAAIEKTGADQIIFDALETTTSENKPFPAEWTGATRPTTPLRELSKRRIGSWCRLCRRSFLDRVGVRFCDARTGEDGPEIYRWALEAHSLVEVDDPCYKYYLRNESVTHSSPDIRFFTKGWQVIDLYNGLGARFPEYSQWFDHWNFIRTRGLLFHADRYLEKTDGRTAEEIEAVRKARAEAQRRFDRLDKNNPLSLVFDFARNVGHRDLRRKILDAERKRATQAAKNASLRAKLDRQKAKVESLAAEKARRQRERDAMLSSLSWYITSPLRVILRPFVGKP